MNSSTIGLSVACRVRNKVILGSERLEDISILERGDWLKNRLAIKVLGRFSRFSVAQGPDWQIWIRLNSPS